MRKRRPRASCILPAPQPRCSMSRRVGRSTGGLRCRRKSWVPAAASTIRRCGPAMSGSPAPPPQGEPSGGGAKAAHPGKPPSPILCRARQISLLCSVKTDILPRFSVWAARVVRQQENSQTSIFGIFAPVRKSPGSPLVTWFWRRDLRPPISVPTTSGSWCGKMRTTVRCAFTGSTMGNSCSSSRRRAARPFSRPGSPAMARGC